MVRPVHSAITTDWPGGCPSPGYSLSHRLDRPGGLYLGLARYPSTVVAGEVTNDESISRIEDLSDIVGSQSFMNNGRFFSNLLDDRTKLTLRKRERANPLPFLQDSGQALVDLRAAVTLRRPAGRYLGRCDQVN